MENVETTLSVQRLHEVTGLDRRTIKARLKNLPEEADLYDLLRVLQTEPETEQIRKKKLSAQAELERLKLEEEQGRLVAKADVEAELADLFQNLHNHFFIRQPRALAGKLANQPEQTVVKVLQDENSRFFEQIRNDYSAVFACLETGNPVV